MTENTSSVDQQITIVKEHLAYLRAEVDKNTELLRSAIRYLLLGIAGLVALREKLNIATLQESLPVAPIIVMALFALFITPSAFILRTGRWMAYEERMLNQIVGRRLLGYEEVLFQQRRAKFYGRRRYYIITIIAVSLCYWLIEVYFILTVNPKLNNQMKLSYLLLAVIPWLISVNYLMSLLRIFKDPLENPPL